MNSNDKSSNWAIIDRSGTLAQAYYAEDELADLDVEIIVHHDIDFCTQ